MHTYMVLLVIGDFSNHLFTISINSYRISSGWSCIPNSQPGVVMWEFTHWVLDITMQKKVHKLTSKKFPYTKKILKEMYQRCSTKIFLLSTLIGSIKKKNQQKGVQLVTDFTIKTAGPWWCANLLRWVPFHLHLETSRNAGWRRLVDM